ncbi:ABC transporter ATP-binding protein [Salinarimonas sp.]|uniref:ABC transporter ATP-binding protein n=1 Tax=Salinarimonas sp. TaxID=2766526 RepID=UPI00391CBE65
MAHLAIRSVTKSFGDVPVLHGIDLDVGEGEFAVFVGPSGCGKSTLLRLVCGLDEVSSGTIAIDGEVVNDVPPARRGLAMVFQSYALYPHMSVAENMGYALRLAGRPKAEIATRVNQAAEILRIGHLLHRKPRELSGGQRQRVAIGRAIVREPRIFLFDEPLSNLDAALRVEMRFELARLKERLGTTTIYVTHDQTEAMTLADRIVVMRDGRVEQVGSPISLYREPANVFVAGFIGSPKMNFLPARVVGRADGRSVRLALPSGSEISVCACTSADAEVTVGVRPEHVALAEPGRAGGLPGRIVMVEQLGSDTYVYLETQGLAQPLLVRVPGERSVRIGETVAAVLDERLVHVFASDGASLRPSERTLSSAA